MRYIIKEMREVVLINNLPHIKKWKETFEVLEAGLSTQSSLKAGFEPDTLVRRDNGEILLLRDEDRGKDILNKEDVISDINSYIKLSAIPNVLNDYLTMILNKMISYERDRKIDNILREDDLNHFI
jgi:hypothetical protein